LIFASLIAELVHATYLQNRISIEK